MKHVSLKFADNDPLLMYLAECSDASKESIPSVVRSMLSAVMDDDKAHDVVPLQ